MILKRLAEGVRNQDWFVVMLEVLIVVVGIFLGLQVDDWNEGRKEQNIEQTVLVALQNDLAASVVSLDAAIVDKNLVQSRLLELAGLAPTGFASIDAKTLDTLIFEGLFETGIYRVQNDITGNLKAAGKLSLIQSDALQRQLIIIGQLTEGSRSIETDYSNMQFQNIDPYLLANYPLRRGAQLDDRGAALPPPMNAKTFDYAEFVFSTQTQNIIFTKFYLGNGSLENITALKDGFLEAIKLIDRQLKPT